MVNCSKGTNICIRYLQDRYELEDLVLNLGLRVDYFDTRTDILKIPVFHLPVVQTPNDF